MMYKGLEIDDCHPDHIKKQYMQQHDEAIIASKSSWHFLNHEARKVKKNEYW